MDYNKGCAIGILPASTIIDYEKANFEQHLSILKDLDQKANKLPIYYSWVNVTCHPEWLKYFEVDAFQIPTVVYFYPEKNKQATLIGKFDSEGIETNQDKFLKGKLPSWNVKVPISQMKMEEKDCQAVVEDFVSDEDAELEAEILREIMEEQAAREKEEKE